VKFRTRSSVRNYIVSPKLYVFKTACCYVLYGNLNFTHASSQKQLKVTVVCSDTRFLSFSLLISAHYPPRSAGIQPLSQQAADAVRPYPDW